MSKAKWKPYASPEKGTLFTPKNNCLACGYLIDAATNIENTRNPRAGDLSICLNCGATAIFQEDLTLRKPTEEEKQMIRDNRLIFRAQIIRAGTITKDLRKSVGKYPTTG